MTPGRALAALALATAATLASACSCAASGSATSPGGPVAIAAAEQTLRGAASGVTPPWPPPPEPAAAAPVPAATVPAAEQGVLEAYARYWELYAGALLALDDSRLPEVMTGPRLRRAREEIERLRLSGQAVHVDVESFPIVGMLAGEEAVIIDRYRNHSYFVGTEDGRPVSARGVATTVHATVSLVQEEGAWKVRESLRERAP